MFGVKEFWNKAVMSGVEQHLEEEKACRQREAYKKAIEIKEMQILEEYKVYDGEER